MIPTPRCVPTSSTVPSRTARSTSRRANKSLTAAGCSSSRSRRKPPQTCRGPLALPKGRAPSSFVSSCPKADRRMSPCCPSAKKYSSYPQGSRRCDSHPPALLWGKCPGPSVPIRLCHGGGSVLLRCCSGIAPVLCACWSLRNPLGIPWVSLRYPLGLLCGSGGSTALGLGHRTLPERNNHIESPGNVSPAIDLLLHEDNDPRTRRRHTMPLIVQRGYFAHASFLRWQQADVTELVAVTPARAARARAEDQDMPFRSLGHTEFEGGPTPALAGQQGPQPSQSKRRSLGRIQKRGQT